VRFTDKTELCWRVNTGIVIEEADLSDWKNWKLQKIKLFVKGECDGSNYESRDAQLNRGLKHEVLMRRNISRAYYALMAEHHRVRAAHYEDCGSRVTRCSNES